MDPLKDAQLALLSTAPPVPPHLPMDQALQEFVSLVGTMCNFFPSYVVAATLGKGGSVLVPCFSTGIIFDLIEQLYLSQLRPVNPYFLISPHSKEHIAFTSICAEWFIIW